MIGAADARCSPLSGSGRDPLLHLPPARLSTPTSAPVAVLFLRAVAGERQGICTSAQEVASIHHTHIIVRSVSSGHSMRGVAALPLSPSQSLTAPPPCRQVQQPVSRFCGPPHRPSSVAEAIASSIAADDVF
jgi:hypothetical protein